MTLQAMRRVRSGTRALCFLIIFLALAAGPVFAQEGEASPADSTTGWVFRWLNFVLVFGAIGYCVVKYAAPAFRVQAEEISRKIAEGARARETAERQRREIKTKLEGLEREIEQLRVDAKRDAEAEAQRLRDMGRAEAEKIERAARAEIDAGDRDREPSPRDSSGRDTRAGDTCTVDIGGVCRGQQAAARSAGHSAFRLRGFRVAAGDERERGAGRRGRRANNR